MQDFDKILFVMEPGQERTWALARAGAFAANVQASLTLLMVAERLPPACCVSGARGCLGHGYHGR